MAARRDAPEMFEAFRLAEAERRRRSQETGKPSEVVPPEAPVTTDSGEADLSGRSGAKTDQSSGRPPVAGRPDRPWTQTGKGQEPAFYLPLGQRCQLVLSVSYRVAVGLGVVLVLALLAAFVSGLLVGGCESSVEPTDQASQGRSLSEVKPNPTPPPAPVVSPAPVAPTPASRPAPIPVPTRTPVSRALYKVQVVTVDNNARGQAELSEMKTVLESRGYRDIEMKTNSSKSKLFMIIGKFGKARRTEAAALATRVKNEPFKGRFPFREAFVVQTSGN